MKLRNAIKEFSIITVGTAIYSVSDMRYLPKK